jgi:hypothetical protein
VDKLLVIVVGAGPVSRALPIPTCTAAAAHVQNLEMPSNLYLIILKRYSYKNHAALSLTVPWR